MTVMVTMVNDGGNAGKKTTVMSTIGGCNNGNSGDNKGNDSDDGGNGNGSNSNGNDRGLRR